MSAGGPGPDETLDSVLGGAVKVLQHRDGYRFSLDAVLLADFALPVSGRAADLGTGSGVVAMILAHRAAQAHVTGIELQPALAERARRSVALNGLGERVEIVEGDVRTLAEHFQRGAFDAVVSNPPYQPRAGGRVNPHAEKALARHELACTIDDVAHAARHLLKDGGRLSVVYPAERLPRLLAALQAEHFTARRLRCVHARANEPARLVLLAAELRGRARFEVMPPLVLHGPARDYLPEAARILGERSGDESP